MTTTSATRPSLFVRLRNPRDREAREALCEFCDPLIRKYLRWLAPQAADLDDLTQDVLVKVLQNIGDFQYDPSRSFRGWLKTVTKNAYYTWVRRRSCEQASGDTAVHELLAQQPVQD